MEKSESVKELAAALSAAQGEMPAVPMGSRNPFLKNKYANLGDVIKTSFPIIAKHGLSVVQHVLSEGNLIGIETILMHSSGEWMSSKMWSDASEVEKGVSSIQVIGKTITYLRRYSLSSILGVYADEDADGNGNAASADAKSQVPQSAPRPAPRPAPVPGGFTQKDLVDYAVSKNVPTAEVSAALRANPETSPETWDPRKEALYKSVVDGLVK